MKRIAAFLLALTACLGLMTVPAAADTGPKPAVTIHVVNAPAEAYYLDLLIPASEAGDYDNLHGKTCDPALLAGLRSWEEEGWVPALSGGTGIPLFGDLLPDEAGSHRFTYYGLPEMCIRDRRCPGPGAADTRCPPGPSVPHGWT